MPRKPPHPGALRKRIAELAAAGRISFSIHAFDERSPERDIDIQDATRVLKLGEIEGAIVPGNDPGEWKCKMVARSENSSRRIGVVTVVIDMKRLLIATVEWEDR
jgi:hypothetical protein